MEDAAARKERLRALKAAAAAATGQDDEAPTTTHQKEADAPVLKFRNYAVRDEKHIQHEKVS